MTISDPLFGLTGKVALVTGGSRGLGREMAIAYAERGADVIVASRKLDACEAVATEISDRFGRRALPIAANVSSWQDCDNLVEAAYDAFGRVDVLVNNAGLSPLYPSLDAVEESLFDKVIAINLKGPFRLTASIGTRMAAGEGGSIINISSVGAIRPRPEFLPYAAAKAGLNTLTEGFARAFGPTVRVNGIMAGRFRTDIAKAWDLDAVNEAAKTGIALQRVGEPNEIVGAALYFASPAASYCTGTILRLDGGATD
ncbi:SDR family NAD(P)-dependent oxidoreductase [[Mycobacterium] burgundiense]|uniref:Glucose 1-dehydrogenase n=1 Tax=[Mycobacterium] burgundiense TaxID=3064286 RepID=A0ABM9L9T2_9MYCO|nr:glucose 1-dehydrogenase [Mycolicibacterium sp. MU0053]CAJ1495355.1 glucose 1-dehydrogenase [Mycolicibacterium sp. MU0053]